MSSLLLFFLRLVLCSVSSPHKCLCFVFLYCSWFLFLLHCCLYLFTLYSFLFSISVFVFHCFIFVPENLLWSVLCYLSLSSCFLYLTLLCSWCSLFSSPFPSSGSVSFLVLFLRIFVIFTCVACLSLSLSSLASSPSSCRIFPLSSLVPPCFPFSLSHSFLPLIANFPVVFSLFLLFSLSPPLPCPLLLISVLLPSPFSPLSHSFLLFPFVPSSHPKELWKRNTWR